MTRSIIPFHKFYDAFHVPETMKIVDEEDQEINIITNIRKLNIIVGANDSGKSYLMRELFKKILFPNNYLYDKKNDLIKKYKEFEERVVKIVDTYSDGQICGLNWKIVYCEKISNNPNKYESISDNDFFFKKNFIIDNIFNDNSEFVKFVRQFIDYWESMIGLLNNEITDSKFLMVVKLDENNKEYRDESDKSVSIALSNEESLEIASQIQMYCQDFKENIFNIHFSGKQFSQLFVVHLRSLVNKFISDYPWKYYLNQEHGSIQENILIPKSELQDSLSSIFVQNGAKLYNDFSEKNRTLNGRKTIAEYENFLSVEVFLGKSVLLHPSYASTSNLKDVTFSEFQIQIGEDEPRFIHELGTGLQMIIILTWCLFEIDYGVIFIEEPELFIHPGLQRQLMNIYTRHPRSERFLFFIATHSNHIVDIAQYEPDLCSVFMIKKKIKDDKPCFVLRNFREDEVIQSLGITQSSLFLANCSIWVEGNTDWKYIRSWFELFLLTEKTKDRFKEGLHYTFVEYGGSLIDHWMFSEELECDTDEKEELKSVSKERLNSKKVSRKSFVIADRGDKNNRKNNKRIKELKKRIGTENFYLTEGYEIENLLAVEVIVDYLKEKGENIDDKVVDKIAEGIKTLPLGSCLDIALDMTKYAEESGTIKNKGNFCNKITKIIRDKGLKAKQIAEESKAGIDRSTFADIISDEGWSLCEKIYEFIKRNNPS